MITFCTRQAQRQMDVKTNYVIGGVQLTRLIDIVFITSPAIKIQVEPIFLLSLFLKQIDDRLPRARKHELIKCLFPAPIVSSYE